MRKLQTVLALLLMSLPAFLFAQDSRFSIDQQYPKQGDRITLTFNPSGTALEGAESVEALVYWMDKKDITVDEVIMKKSGNSFSGDYTINKTATAAIVKFIAGDKSESNQKKGFLLKIFDDKQQLVEGGNGAIGKFYIGYLGMAGIDRDLDLAAPYLEKEYNTYPENRQANFNMYFNSLRDKPNLNEIILAEIPKIEAGGKLTENDYLSLINWYNTAKEKEKAEAIREKMKQQFPKGSWKMRIVLDSITKETDAAKREQSYEAYLKEFNIEDPNYVRWQLATTFVKEKNWDKFNAVVKGLDYKKLAGMYNNTAWGWVERDENLEAAKTISKLATDYAKKEMENPTAEKPKMRTVKQWKEDRQHTFAMYADTYAYILYKQKDYKTGFGYIKEAVTIQKKKDAEYNDRYALLLEQVAPAAQVKKEMEELVKNGAAGKDAREVLHRSYVKVNKSDKGYEAYMAGLDAANLEKLKEELKKKMISKDAPDFRLVNLQGNEVDFASLKGKVVVVDFWATWCGPCISSFPSMQKMVHKYKNNPDVVFLFIDTWENVPNRKKLVEDFVAKYNYTFNVLYDKPKEEGSSEFTVVKDYEVEGIPTKFVVDGNGQIRFKSIGWSGNEFAFMQELQLMIEMAGQAGSGERGKKGF